MIPSDPVMLLSFINMKLRDSYPNLSALCDDLDVSESEIVKKLNDIGYTYNKDTNQFT